MVDLLRRIYKAELIKPREPQLPARPDGPVRDRQEPDEGAASDGVRRSSTRPARSTALPTTSASSPCPTVTGSRSRSSRAAAPTGRAPSPRPRGRSTTGSRRSFDLAVRRAPPSARNSAAPHRRAREDRPLSGGRAGRPLSEADRLADEGDRASRARRQASRRCPANSVTIVLDERGEALSSMRAGEEARALARRRQARGALPDRRRRRP